jgi:hypothetical protein
VFLSGPPGSAASWGETLTTRIARQLARKKSTSVLRR